MGAGTPVYQGVQSQGIQTLVNALSKPGHLTNSFTNFIDLISDFCPFAQLGASHKQWGHFFDNFTRPPLWE